MLLKISQRSKSSIQALIIVYTCNRFKWAHLNERLAYERISMKQKLKAELAAAKREAAFFAKSVDLSKRLKKHGVLNNEGLPISRSTEIEANVISSNKKVSVSKRKNSNSNDRSKFLKSIFGNE